jgi:hypothetical protein
MGNGTGVFTGTHLYFPCTSVEKLDLAAGRKCCDSCDKRLPLAAFKEDSDGGGVL